MRRITIAGMITAAVLGVVAVSAAWCAETTKSPLSDEAFGRKVRAYLLAHPEVIAEAINNLKAKQEVEAANQAKKAIADNKALLERAPGDPTLGTGPVTVVEFFDYRCAYCKAAAPRIPDMVIQNKSIRLVFKEFPILTEVSEHAARAALAAELQGKYLPVHLGFMAEKALDDAAIDRILKDKGVDVDRAHADMKSAAITKKLDDNKALARSIGVDGTPGFIVGDKMIGGFLEDEILAEVKAQSKTTQKPGA